MAVCPLILNFSSPKWLVFANYFGLPNFLPQVPNCPIFLYGYIRDIFQLWPPLLLGELLVQRSSSSVVGSCLCSSRRLSVKKNIRVIHWLRQIRYGPGTKKYDLIMWQKGQSYLVNLWALLRCTEEDGPECLPVLAAHQIVEDRVQGRREEVEAARDVH